MTLLAGRKITFLVDPSLVFAMARNAKDLNFGPFREEVQQVAFATSSAGSAHPAIGRKIYPDAFRHFRTTTMSSITSDFSHRALCALRSTEAPSSSLVSLWDFVFPIIYRTSSKATFGASFPETTFSDFVQFDEGFTFLVSRIPTIFLRRYDAARARLITRLVQWTNADKPDVGVDPGASDLVKEAVKTMKEEDFRPSDIGAHLRLAYPHLSTGQVV